MKMIIALLVFGSLFYLFMVEYSNPKLIQITCARKANVETRRVYYDGFKIRDRPTEEQNFEKCMEDAEGSSLWDILVKYGGTLAN